MFTAVEHSRTHGGTSSSIPAWARAPLLAASLLLLASSASASPGGGRATADTIVPAKGPATFSSPRASMTALPRPRTNPALAAKVAESFAHDTLGTPWPRWIEATRPAHCEPYRATSYEPVEDVFWVHRCRIESEGVSREAESFLLERDSVPTLERTRWSSGRESGVLAWDTNVFADSLVHRLESLLGTAPDLRVREAPGGYDGGWLQIAEFAGPARVLRLLRGNDDDRRDSLILEATSPRLETAIAAAFEHGSPYQDGDRGEVRGRREIEERVVAARALRSISPALASALDSVPSRAADAPAIARALARAPRDPDDANADLIRWGAHLWGSGIATPDSTAADRVNRAFGERLGRCTELPDGWCWEDSLLEPLASRAGANRWADAALLELLDRGWQATCELCGYDPQVGTDLFRPVIAHGEAFLRDHPDSPIAHEVRWRVAEAHETAWSLSKVPPGDDYIEPARYLLHAPEHRARVIQLYERLLSDEPPGPRRSAAMERFRRIRLDVDTGFHVYWCEWD